MTNHPNRGQNQTGNYAIVDSHGAFDSAGKGRSYIHYVYSDEAKAKKAAKYMRQVQVIQGNSLIKGEVVYEDAVGSVYPRVP